MKQSFEIYPALLRITPRRTRNFPGINMFEFPKGYNEHAERQSGHDISFPHLFYGHCIVNAAHTLVTLALSKMLKIATAFEIPDPILDQLNIETFEGKHYVITYVPVMN